MNHQGARWSGSFKEDTGLGYLTGRELLSEQRKGGGGKSGSLTPAGAEKKKKGEEEGGK